MPKKEKYTKKYFVRDLQAHLDFLSVSTLISNFF